MEDKIKKIMKAFDLEEDKVEQDMRHLRDNEEMRNVMEKHFRKICEDFDYGSDDEDEQEELEPKESVDLGNGISYQGEW